MCNQALIDKGMDEATFYNKRKEYMLERVDEAYSDRNISKKVAVADSQYESRTGSQNLNDGQPKWGKSVTLDRTSDAVTDADIAMIETAAMLQGEANNKHNTKYKEKWGSNNSSLTNANSLLGRAPGTSPNFVDSKTTDADGNEITTKTYNYGLSQAEKDKLKQMDRKTLLDKFYGTNTSKY